MPSILEHSIITSYEKCGWDVETSEHKFKEPIFPTVEDVLVCVKDYIDQSEYSAEAKGNYKGAIEKRLQDLCEGMFDKMFNRESISDDELFNKNTIIDLSRTGSTETNALVMGFLVIKLNEFRMSECCMNSPLRHVTVLEEAHNLLRKVSTSQSMETANVVGKSVEMITNSIAEMRTYGESFIIVDQSPSLLDSATIRNTNTKIVLSLPDVEDRKVAGGSMSLSDEQIDEIARQNQGEAIVYQNHWEEPIQCKVDYFNDYESGFVYNKKTPLNKKRDRSYNIEIVEFLLFPYLKKNFNIDKIEEIIYKAEMLSSIKFSLIDLVNEYKMNNKLNIWEEYNFADLSIVIRKYLNIDNTYNNIIAQNNKINVVRIKLDIILKDIFKQDLYPEFFYYVQMCFLHTNPHYKDWRKTFVNNKI
jgi:hypothetical protein